MSHWHPGYVYRLVGTHMGSKVAITDWARDRGQAEKMLACCLAEDRAEGMGDTRADYNIECISADWLA